MVDGARADPAVEAWREREAPQADRVHLRILEALARRAANHEGAVRRVLDERLAQLVAAHRRRLDQPQPPHDEPRPPADGVPPARSMLAELVADLGERSAARMPSAASPEPTSIGAAVELETLPFFRRTWSRLSADQRLAQSQAALPQNAGPLNSHHLVHRSLTLMRELSPGYFDRFVAHVDALLSLQQGSS
ncbi:DUF2894 domain-containing protein [Rhizobacter sp. SG703]|uniref:DUF2894 domain-containing protein n=1 Tax=Rhizobacter sp. SG703 TaxID=2587140 RepID=UPI001445DA2D|nr:DUF2894 domain-containing protein [Rhizobacter sp. SG703]NKI94299.1 hypothetical protein [Rhizobacter sp. SG703]